MIRFHGGGLNLDDPATALASPARIWTRDKRLAVVAATLNLKFQPETH
ncbi:hypothetical protein [uncultured Lamprocystis sp.]|nr:hypothetical protein [uncultured Lamprocystis sp.]